MDLRCHDHGIDHGPSSLIALLPGRDVETEGDATIAVSDEPWMIVAGFDIAKYAGRFVTIVYSASLWDAPSRPIFRFCGANGSNVDRIAPGPFMGRGLWTGRVPIGATALHVSPTACAGRFAFRIDSICPRLAVALLIDGFRWNARSARSAVLTRLIGWKPESDVNLAWAIGSRPLSHYARWRARRVRPIDIDGIDRPRFDWTTANPIRIIVMADGDAASVAATLASLSAQVFPKWSASVLGTKGPFDDPRIRAATLQTALDDVPLALACVVQAGTVFEPAALAIVAECAARTPAATIFYGDAVHRDRDGRLQPHFTPGWSPRLQAALPYIDLALVSGAERWPQEVRDAWLETGVLPATVAANLKGAAVVALRRVLIEKPAPSPLPSPSREVFAPAGHVRVAIVIPTRDNAALLRRIIASIRARSPSGRYEIVVVDNGSVAPETVSLLATLHHEPDIRVIAHPGPFNFSLMCNIGAAASIGEVLVFLNDDTEILSDGWLDRLATHAVDPSTGAVGAKLTYPDGRLQHVGVLVGMGESAGHFGAPAPGDDPGWVGRNAVAHEVSAVTGACLAVARAKFEAVGGFDADDLPIELSDIDLCLKLNARGWQTILDPKVHLMHEESFSRGGATFRRLDVYDNQRAIFIARWRPILRDDPAFHPGLSLYSFRAALG